MIFRRTLLRYIRLMSSSLCVSICLSLYLLCSILCHFLVIWRRRMSWPWGSLKVTVAISCVVCEKEKYRSNIAIIIFIPPVHNNPMGQEAQLSRRHYVRSFPSLSISLKSLKVTQGHLKMK